GTGSCGLREGSPQSTRAWPSQPGQLRRRVAEAVPWDAHSPEQAQVQTAQLAILVAPLAVVEDASGGQRSAEAADRQERHLARIVLRARPQVRQEQQA